MTIILTFRQAAELSGMDQLVFTRSVRRRAIAAVRIPGGWSLDEAEAVRLVLRRNPTIRSGMARWATCGRHMMMCTPSVVRCPGIPNRGVNHDCGLALRPATDKEIIKHLIPIGVDS
jgi:hypothetical protein